MTAWWNGGLVGFDLETTGVDVDNDRVVTASIIWDAPGKERRIENFLLDPGVEIPEAASAVHGVSTEVARANGLPAAEGIKAILDVLHKVNNARVPFVAFNAPYDFTLINREAERHGLRELTPHAVVDPLVLDRQFDRYRKGKRTLVRVAELNGVALDNAHESEFDAIAAVEIARKFGRKYELYNLDELQTLQTKWHKAWAENLTAFFASKGSTDVVQSEWPLQQKALIPA